MFVSLVRIRGPLKEGKGGRDGCWVLRISGGSGSQINHKCVSDNLPPAFFADVTKLLKQD